jgi:hypothetical protein
MSQSTARVGVIGDLMLEHFEGFLLAGDASKGVSERRGDECKCKGQLAFKNGKNPF